MGRQVPMVTFGERYKERAEKALVETIILSELGQYPGLPVEELTRRVKTITGLGNEIDNPYVQRCMRRLHRGRAVAQAHGRYTLTPEGLEDVTLVSQTLRTLSDNRPTASEPTPTDEGANRLPHGIGGTLGP